MIGFELKTLLRWSSYFFEISLMLGFISSSSRFQGQNHDSLLFINSMILFFLSPILLDYIEDFSGNKIKNICNVLTLDDMHASLPDLKYRSPSLRCSIITGCLCLLFKAFFILSMYWLIRVLAFHSNISVVPILGSPRRLLLSVVLKLDHASKCGVARFIMKKLNKSSIS